MPDNDNDHRPLHLPSLDFLKNHRRGSITDPVLHAAHLNTTRLSSTYRHSSDQPSSASSASPSAHYESLSKHHFSEPRPSSPYVFGDATPHPPPEPGSQLRKLLHSPSPDQSSHRQPSSFSSESQGSSRTLSAHMDVDSDRHLNIGRRSIRDPPSFDFTMRRHSIAVGQNPITLPNLSSLHGTKRKMSADRNSFAPVGEDVDPQLVGPGIPSIMDVDVDAPAPKRRGSTIDTRRIAQLSLNDRRNSVDSRSSHWPSNDRRDSAPSLFPTVTVPGINSFNPGYNSSDAPNIRMSSSLAPFSWPSTSQSEDSSATSSHDGASHTGRVFDPVHESNTIPPPANYLSDRRMSVPDELTHRSSSRTVHSRSRPPSRQQTADHSGVSSGQEDSQPSTSTPSTAKPSGKEPGSTPYSRSPELRVSHKLAERKRRKEMKDLFDELREQLPSDRGMKASKWEILSKAIEYVTNLKQSHKMLEQEIISLKQQLGQQQQRQDSLSNFSSGISAPHPGYSQGPSLYNSTAPHLQQSHAALNHSGHADSRSESTQNAYSSPNPSSSTQNGTSHRDLHPT